MAAPSPSIATRTSWEAFERETLDWFRALIRLDTTNPPGNERLAANYIAAQLEASGIDSVRLEAAAGRTNLIARLPGSDSANAPLMLASHTDVVPAEPKRWTHAPFGAEIAEGCIWGRGAIDMKSKCAMDLGLAVALRRARIMGDRDVILAATADEESGSQFGAQFLIEQHPDLVRAGFVLNEVGGFTMYLGGRRFYPIQIAEKGFVTVRMTVAAAPGHGSIPRPVTAITRLAELITRIANAQMRVRLTPPLRRTLAALGLTRETVTPLFRPMLSNTVTPTIVRAGYKDNVIPGEASVILDGRTLPGEDVASFIAELRGIVGPEPGLEVLKSAPAAESSIDTPLYRLIAERVEAADPGAIAVPWMLPGATDSKFYARLGAVCYGFSPVKLGPMTPFGSLYHGNDERLPIDGFQWGLRLYTEVVLNFLGIRFDSVFE
ncbi:MAG TPA: M20/M25/M40 family metallo-hydrolase [Candidatus Binataceae bacterium]|nr:M20/M25/M40 family metallo-hydrolase [Candidatus Binataceae bacterium]